MSQTTKIDSSGNWLASCAKPLTVSSSAGIESLVSWIRCECLDDIKGVQSWAELHQVMRENGLELRQRANGFVIGAGDGTMVKASTVARDLSRPKLEARLGAFEPSAEQAVRVKARKERNTGSDRCARGSTRWSCTLGIRKNNAR
ncbi:hypothetical protein [Thiolapillus sp.]|uniref:hypothetical protein n=1 Tax=Thiolapillus sp. TaxID=2017437 RepID=UPI003AF53BAA